MNKLKAILKDESGQGMLEYVLLLAVIVTMIVVFKGQIKQYVESWTQKIGQKGEQALSD